MEAASDEFDADDQMILEDALGAGVAESMGCGCEDVEGPCSHIDAATITTTGAGTSAGGLRNEVLSVPVRVSMRKEYPEWSERRQAYIDIHKLFKPFSKNKLSS